MDAESKFTPGPWYIHSMGRPCDVYVGPPSIGRCIISCDQTATISEAEQNANARLIAAAPELVAALQKVTQMHARDGGVIEHGKHRGHTRVLYEDRIGAIDAVRAALDKAGVRS